MIQNAIYSVISMLIIIAIGYFAGGTKVYKQHDCGTVVTVYLKYIGIPIYMCYNAISNFDNPAQVIELLRTLPYSLLTVGLAFAVSVVLAKLMRIPPSRRGTFVNACGFSNTVFLGFPIISSIFGEEILTTGMVFYAANTLIFWTIGIYMLRLEGGKVTSFFSKKNFKQMFAPPLIGLIIGLLIAGFSIPVPSFIQTVLKNVSGTSSPLGMMFIGTVIREADLRRNGILRDIAALFVTRFIFFPVILLVILHFMPIALQTKQAFYMLALMPAMTQLGVMSRDSGGDYPFASVWITISTILGVVSIPLFTLVMERFLT